jgi:hypothetical protein
MTRKRLVKVDDSMRSDHYHLNQGDDCFYFGEYSARKGYGFSDTNQLIKNFKWPANAQWNYRAKIEIANDLLGLDFSKFTIIPVPPSKCKTDTGYDDRLMDVLRLVKSEKATDILEIVTQLHSMVASHQSNERPTPQELAKNYVIDPVMLAGAKNEIVIFDDMLTAGAHFRAMVDALSGVRPDLSFTGLFVARRVVPNPFSGFS